MRILKAVLRHVGFVLLGFLTVAVAGLVLGAAYALVWWFSLPSLPTITALASVGACYCIGRIVHEDRKQSKMTREHVKYVRGIQRRLRRPGSRVSLDRDPVP